MVRTLTYVVDLIYASSIYQISVVGYLPARLRHTPGFDALILSWLSDFAERTRVRKLMDSA